jgi:UDP-N-acetylglucosamine 2-epimerase (non-hydrolysing)
VKLLTLFGTRPEIIRLSAITRRLDECTEQVLVHTGQNSDPNLSEVFFEELRVRRPDICLGVDATQFAEQAGQIITRAAEAFARVAPDRILILGDTNSGLAAIAAARMRIPVYHLEAGNRCYDDAVPEEVNRRIIDHCSAVLMPYTQRSKDNLVREGIDRSRIFVVGNPIFEVLFAHQTQIDADQVLSRLGLSPGRYFLATMHRAENVDHRERLQALVQALDQVGDQYEEPVVVSVHPHTADRLAHFGVAPSSGWVRFMKPMGFFDFAKLERHAHAVLTDSGTVQEECCILRVPNVTLRDSTERPETIEAGSSVMTGVDAARIARGLHLALSTPLSWTPPGEYVDGHVSATVAKILVGR